MNTKHNQEPTHDDVDQLIKKMAETVHEKATNTAKSRFAELMKDAHEKELDPDEMELYYEAFSELTRTPDEARDFVMKQLQHLLSKASEDETNDVIIIEQAASNIDNSKPDQSGNSLDKSVKNTQEDMSDSEV